MSNWKTFLANDATDWLLDESNPHVHYFALRWLMDRPESHHDVVKARQAIAESAGVQKLIRHQRPEGYWGSNSLPHHGTRGQLMLLEWLGVPKNDAIDKAMQYRMDGCVSKDGHYFIKSDGRTEEYPCHGALLLQSMLAFGFADDPRARKLLDWLVSSQEEDGVWVCPPKTKRFPCMWATADILGAFNDLPTKWVTAQVKAARARTVELFLNSNLSQYGKKKADPGWFRFGYPLFWTSDILDVLESVAPYVSPDEPRIQAGLKLVLEKQDKHGRWPCEKYPKGGKWFEQYAAIDRVGEPSKWVTLHVYRVLKTLYA